jgi:hypothetical protein
LLKHLPIPLLFLLLHNSLLVSCGHGGEEIAFYTYTTSIRLRGGRLWIDALSSLRCACASDGRATLRAAVRNILHCRTFVLNELPGTLASTPCGPATGLRGYWYRLCGAMGMVWRASSPTACGM